VVGNAVDKPAFVNALSPLTGLPLWRTEIPAADEFYLGLTDDRLSVVSAAGEVRSLNAVNGEPSWKISIRGIVSSTPKFSDERIVISTRTNRVEAISTATGSTT